MLSNFLQLRSQQLSKNEIGLKQMFSVTWQGVVHGHHERKTARRNHSDLPFKLFSHFLLVVASVQCTARLSRCCCLHSYPRRRNPVTTNPILSASRSDNRTMKKSAPTLANIFQRSSHGIVCFV